MIKEFNFSFSELVPDRQMINEVLGYSDGILPSPFDDYLEEALTEAGKLPDIRAAYTIIDEVVVEERGRKVQAGGIMFNVGKTVCGELKDSSRLAFFVCTAGKTISEKSGALLKGENPVLGYAYDVLGSAIAEAAGDKIEAFLRNEVAGNGEKITNRYSPGYCNWSVADQHKLFSFFNGDPCGVTLTDSALMHPVKSISGIIGIGQSVKYRDYQCTLCLSENCIYRKVMSK